MILGLEMYCAKMVSTIVEMLSYIFRPGIHFWSYAVEDVIVKSNPLFLYHSVKTRLRVIDCMAKTLAIIVSSGHVA